MIQTATQNMLEAVNAIVTKARSKHSGIPETVVVLGASGRGKIHGHYAPRSWEARKGEDKYGEVLLSGESLARGAVPTLGTLLHELAHAYCDANDIQDTSNAGRYHNAKFKEVAERFGLTIEKADTIGWSTTTVPDSTVSAYAPEIEKLEEAITTHRRTFAEVAASATPQIKRKMQCVQCKDPLLVTLKWWNANDPTCRLHDGAPYELIEE